MIDQAILVEDESFCVIKGACALAVVSWNSITEITALRQLLPTGESLSLEVRYEPGDCFVEVSDEMLGFDDLIKTFRTVLPRFETVWRVRSELFSDSPFVSIYRKNR